MKTKEEILNQSYLNASELKLIIPMSNGKALKYINEIRNEMKEKGLLVPETRPKIALTKIIKKKFGL